LAEIGGDYDVPGADLADQFDCASERHHRPSEGGR
jgi:hypothetical protein